PRRLASANTDPRNNLRPGLVERRPRCIGANDKVLCRIELATGRSFIQKPISGQVDALERERRMVSVEIPRAGGFLIDRFRLDPDMAGLLQRHPADKRIVVLVLAKAVTAVKELGRLTAFRQATVLAERFVAMMIGNPIVTLVVENAGKTGAALAIQVSRR